MVLTVVVVGLVSLPVVLGLVQLWLLLDVVLDLICLCGFGMCSAVVSVLVRLWF